MKTAVFAAWASVALLLAGESRAGLGSQCELRNLPTTGDYRITNGGWVYNWSTTTLPFICIEELFAAPTKRTITVVDMSPAEDVVCQLHLANSYGNVVWSSSSVRSASLSLNPQTLSFPGSIGSGNVYLITCSVPHVTDLDSWNPSAIVRWDLY